MYTTIRNYPGNTALLDALVAHEAEVKSLIGGIDGFMGYFLLRTSDGGATSISVFDSPAGAEESTRVATAWLKENLADVAVSPPQVITGEVVIELREPVTA